MSIDCPLFELAEQSAFDRLRGSVLAGLLPGEKVADLFCGAGGWGEGLRALGVRVDFAVNHSAQAIETHTANNPGCKHHQGDAWRTRPRDVVGDASLGILFASAACTTHSRARGSAPISKRVHMLGWCIARWMEDVQPRVVFIENVPEWKDWGPTIDDGGVRRQDPARKGQHFRRWWQYCQRLGYDMEMRVLDAPDYGAACRRRRLFIIARRDGQPICWPEVTHVRGLRGDEACSGACVSRTHRAYRRSDGAGGYGKGHQNQDAVLEDPRSDHGAAQHGAGLLGCRTAADVIDWSDLGTSIFSRKRPLRPKTLARIAEGIRRYVLNDPAPFVLRVTQGDGWHVSGINKPMPTQTTRQDVAVCTPVIMHNTSGHAGACVDGPLPTITTGGQSAVCTPIMATVGYGERSGQAARVQQVHDLLNTCVNGVKQGLVAPVLAVCAHGDGKGGTTRWGRPALPLTDPMNAIHAGGNNFGVVSPVLVNFRGTAPAQVAASGQSLREPLAAITQGGTHAMLVAPLLTEFYGNSKGGAPVTAPMGACTTLDRHGLVVVLIDGVEFVIVDILFRMLKPRELAAAMGFRPDFQWPKSQRAAVQLIGNAVSPAQATALIRGAMPGLGPKRRKVRAA